MNENRTDDEKTGALRMATQNGICTTDSEKEALRYDAGGLKSKPATQGSFQAPLEETIDVVTAPSAESSAASRMDGLLLKLEETKSQSSCFKIFRDHVRWAGVGGDNCSSYKY